MVLVLGFFGNYIAKKDGLPNRTHLESNDEFKKQFVRTPAQNDLGISLVNKILGYKPSNNYIKSTSDDITKKYILIMGDSHAHTSYPGFAQEFKKYGYETLLLSNSSCPPYLGGAMGKDFKDLNQCKKKIDSIYELINNKLNIHKIILTTRHGYMYDMGFGIVDGGNKPYNYHYEEFFKSELLYNQKLLFLGLLEKTFNYFNSNVIEFYYLIENPELGFSPKNCMIRPFDIFPNNCRLTLASYLERSGEYRDYVYKLSKKYKSINILDPKNMYCDDKYCYAIKDGKMLYADDDHHSVNGSIMQAKYFIKSIIHHD